MSHSQFSNFLFRKLKQDLNFLINEKFQWKQILIFDKFFWYVNENFSVYSSMSNSPTTLWSRG